METMIKDELIQLKYRTIDYYTLEGAIKDLAPSVASDDTIALCLHQIKSQRALIEKRLQELYREHVTDED